ncbi:TPA: transcription factor S [Candidatus Bathyarchaeota archaeon]|nr:transcription factor S [Candidatus Bathyarchaeota archaeon]
MEFCPKCGTRLVHKRLKEGAFLVCPRCGYKKKAESPIPTPRARTPVIEESVIVIGKEEQQIETMPVVTIECPRCGNNKAYVWQVQTRGADESTTQFFRCTKCGYTFREYS